MKDKTEFARIVPLSIQEKAADLVINSVRDDVEAIFAHGEPGSANKAYGVAAFRGQVMNIAMTALFAGTAGEITKAPASPDAPSIKSEHYEPGSNDIGRQGGEALRRRGYPKFSAPNYAFRSIPQLRELMSDLIDEYMDNRDIEWFSEQSRLIDAAAQVAYSKGRY